MEGRNGRSLGGAVHIHIEIPGVKLGVLEADGLRVEAVPALAEEMDQVCARLRSELTVEKVAELEPIRDVRAMFRAWGLDPSRYRPSAEALLRRVAQGKGLYPISNVVDICNLGSVETGWPYGLYDRAKFTEPVTLRLGQAGETYEGIGKQTWHVAERPVLVDSAGPFGSPISDSTRTMITENTKSLLLVIFAPIHSAEADIRHALERFGARIARYAGGRVTLSAIQARTPH
jgi:DNA/RNA-binding domain of Phe-tRNA-synthetase-like protein